MTKNKKGKKISNESKGNAAEASTKEEVTSKEDKKAMGKDNNDLHSQQVALSAKNSRKKRIRAKSGPKTSKTEAMTNAEYERQKLDCSEMLVKNLELQKLISARISKIESGKSDAKSIKHMKRYKVVPSTSQEKKQKTTFNTSDEKVQGSSESKPAIKSNSAKPVKNPTGSFSGLTLKTEIERPASANTLQNVAEKKWAGRDNVKSANDLHATMQSKAEAKSESKKASGYFRDNLTFQGDGLLFAPRKTSGKGKIDEKPLPSTSEKEFIINPDYKRYEVDWSDAVRKDVDMGKSNPRSSTNESGTTDDSKIDDCYRPVIFVTDRSTQTDPLQKPPNNLKLINAEMKSACNSDPDRTVITEAKETDLLQSPGKARTANVSDDSGSNLNSLDQILQSISQDFLNDLKIANESFTDGFIKCFMN